MLTYNTRQFEDWTERVLNNCKKDSGIDPSFLDFLFHFNATISTAENNIRIIQKEKGKQTIISKDNWMMSLSKDERIFRLTNAQNGKTGYSKLNRDDISFNYRTALAVAWTRYCKNEIPKLKKTITSLTINKLKPNDIVRDIFSGGEYAFIGRHPAIPDRIIVCPTFGDNWLDPQVLIVNDEDENLEVVDIVEK